MSVSMAVRPRVASGRTPIVGGAKRRATLAVLAPTAHAVGCRRLVPLGPRRAATGVPPRGLRGCVRSSCRNTRAPRLTVRSALELPKPIANTCNFLTNLFPLWVAAGAVVALQRPELVSWFHGEEVTRTLSLTMLGMGLTTPLSQFNSVLQIPKAVVAGVFLQYTIMPFFGYWIGTLLALPTPLRVGLVLVACCPGGTASNLVTYLARANVALSVVLTTVSTALACVMTPLLTQYLVGSVVPINTTALILSTLQMVALPVAVGVLLNTLLPGMVRLVAPLCPLFAVLAVSLICSSVIASSSSAILSGGLTVIAAVLLLHTAGFSMGFVLAKLLGFPSSTARTISIEVGMQNSALGAVLATQHFASPLTAIPCAISASCHSCIGSVLAGAWRLSDRRGAGDADSKDGAVVYRF